MIGDRPAREGERISPSGPRVSCAGDSMAVCGGFRDGNVHDLVEGRCIDRRHVKFLLLYSRSRFPEVLICLGWSRLGSMMSPGECATGVFESAGCVG